MNYQIYIENLGAIEKADLTISPLTIIAGENGTGKSFVTKFLYAVLNVLISDIYHDEVIETIYKLEKNIELFTNNEEFKESSLDLNEITKLNYFLNSLKNDLENLNVPYGLFDFRTIFDLEEIKNSYFVNSEITFKNDALNSENFSERYMLSISEVSNRVYKTLKSNIAKLLFLIKDPQIAYEAILHSKLANEIKENFQVSELNQLVNANYEVARFEIKDLINIIFSKTNQLTTSLNFERYQELLILSRIIFFESPVYWKALSIIDNNNITKRRFLSNRINDVALTGIPKHFTDLKELLFTNFKDGERPNFIVEVADDLARHLKGKFHANNNDLTFENDKGQTIPKSLVSFGMTNLGILQAVLSKNIINVGSFIFIDEPESNLHPAWQNILAETLVKLAENGVFVVITTHSTDMLKALDIITQEKQKANDTKIKYDFLSTYYFQNDGLLLDTSNSELSPIEQARQKLLEPYDNMMVRGYLL